MALTDVPPRTVPTVNVVFGSAGVSRSAIPGDRASHGVYGARQAEFLKAVAARSAEDHLVAKASGRAIDHAGDAEAVDRDEPVDVAVVAEQRLDPAQIAELLLAHGADQHHVAGGGDRIGI